MLSNSMKSVVGRLQHDWNFISDFLDDPKSALKEYDLSNKERDVLSTRDVDGLIELGFDEGMALGAPSGAHSRTCSTSCNARD